MIRNDESAEGAALAGGGEDSNPRQTGGPWQMFFGLWWGVFLFGSTRFFCLKVFPGLGCAQTFKLTLSVVLFLRGWCLLAFFIFCVFICSLFSAWWCRVLMNPSLCPSGVDGPQPDVCLRKWTKQHSTTAHTIQTQPKEASTDLYITLCYKQKYLIKKLFIVVAFYVMHILLMWYIYVL